MAQQPSRNDPTIASMSAQLDDMTNELYDTESSIQRGTFAPRELVVHVASPSSTRSNRTRRPSAAAATTSPLRKTYQCRTLNTHNFKRMAILPIFPLTRVTMTPVTAATATTTSSLGIPAKAAQLLLTSVPLDLLNPEQYARVHHGTHPTLFKLEVSNRDVSQEDSFLLSFYQELYGTLKERLKVDVSILDFNLVRLRYCASQVAAHYQLKQTMLHLDELAIGLEFYLQIDVDMFYLKTCSFHGAEPRLFDRRYYEGLFCLGRPLARYSLARCGKSTCHCCHSPCPRRDATVASIPFSVADVHRFVNKYEAILNCPATCESQNCIYVLTCPCKQVDFIGESKESFAETLALHREEGNRIVREFLIGERNVNYLMQGSKSEKKKANDQSWLYQHSARCSMALQIFLDYNPEYWCFVPWKNDVEQQPTYSAVRGYLARLPASYRELPSASESDFLTTWNRKDNEVRLLIQNLPQPPIGYGFTTYQRQQQANFFKWVQDRNVPLHNVDLYNANIIAVLPDNVSKLFRKTIESLFITHAECKLNQMGHLLSSNVNPNRALNNSWCVNLTHPSMSSSSSSA